MVSRRALERGISLVEVVIVATIALVLFGMAAPAAQNNDVAGAVARSMVSDAVRARSYARRSWEAVTMQVDTNNGRWRTLHEDGTPFSNTTLDANGWCMLPPEVEFQVIDGMPSDLVFLPNGRASQSAAVHLVFSNQTWLLAVDSLSARVYAEPVQ